MRTLKISLLVFILSIGISPQNFWEQTNGPHGPFIRTLTINSNDHIITGSSGGPPFGIFYSTNNGNYWFQKETFVISSTVFNVNNDIFVGTNDGVYRSTDYGDSWTHLNLIINVRSLAIYSSNPIFAGTDNGIFRSSDNGDNWTEINNGLPEDLEVNCLAINSNGDVFSSGRKLINPDPPTYEYFLFRSTNSGVDWTQLAFSFFIKSIIIDSYDHIFVGTSSNGVFLSVNNGNSWTQKNNGLTNNIVNSLKINQSSFVYAGTDAGIFYTTNNGENWVDITNDLPSTSVLALGINSSNDIFTGTMNGIYHSTNNGTNWRMINKGLCGTDFRSLTVDLSGNIFGGTWNDGVFYSSNNGDDWIQRNNGLGSLIVQSLVTKSGGIVFAGAYGVFKSTNNGINWSQTSLTNEYILSFAINSDGHIFASAYKSIFRSTDNGDNWVEVSNGFTNLDIRSLAINPNGHIFAGVNGDGVFRSTDNGDTWSKINNGLSSRSVRALAINSSGTMFCGAWKYVFRSTDNGDTWIQTSLNGYFVSSIAIDSNGYIYVGDRIYGAFYSIDNGENWYEINNGLTYNSISSLAISSDYIFSGIVYGGVFRRINSPTSVDNTENLFPETFSLSQNYPNPFNPSTKIQYSVNSTQKVTLKVYDLLGREIATLLNEEKAAGNYEVVFDGSALPSGIYFYKLQAGNFIETKKMVLLKRK